MTESCDWIRERIPRFVDGELTVEERGAVERHLERCSGCRKRLEFIERADRAAGDVLGDPTAEDRTNAEAFLEALKTRHDLEASARRRHAEIVAGHSPSMSAEEAASAPLEKDIQRSRPRGFRAWLIRPAPAWRWAGLTAAAAAAITAVLLVREPDLPHEAYHEVLPEPAPPTEPTTLGYVDDDAQPDEGPALEELPVVTLKKGGMQGVETEEAAAIEVPRAEDRAGVAAPAAQIALEPSAPEGKVVEELAPVEIAPKREERRFAVTYTVDDAEGDWDAIAEAIDPDRAEELAGVLGAGGERAVRRLRELQDRLDEAEAGGAVWLALGHAWYRFWQQDEAVPPHQRVAADHDASWGEVRSMFRGSDQEEQTVAPSANERPSAYEGRDYLAAEALVAYQKALARGGDNAAGTIDELRRSSTRHVRLRISELQRFLGLDQ